MSTEIISIEKYNLADLFDPSKREVVEAFVKHVETSALSEVIDCETEEGRKRSWNVARQVSAAKTTVDDYGKAIVADAKTRIAKVDGIRKGYRDHLDAIRDKVLAPRVEWEKKEEARQQGHRDAISYIVGLAEPLNASLPLDKQLAEVHRRADDLAKVNVDGSFEEFRDEAAAEYTKVSEWLNSEADRLKKQIQQEAELEQLRKEKEDREAEAEKERLRIEGEERAKAKAKKDAEDKLAADQAKLAADRVAFEAKQLAAEQKAAEPLNASPSHAPIPDTPQPTQAAPASVGEAIDSGAYDDRARKAQINRAAAKAIEAAGGISNDEAKQIVRAIFLGKVPGVTIHYK
jgi:hypothetical protein